jgi:hypothetical protein
MATISPNPFPTNGIRTLGRADYLIRQKAMQCALPKDNTPSCAGQVFVGIFFDGTGNNLHYDYEMLPADKRKHSNIVKLFQTFKDKPSDGYLPYYIPGVGTPFDKIGDKNGTIDAKGKEHNNKGMPVNLGSVAAEKGEDRILWAFTQLLNAPHQYLFGGDQFKTDAASADFVKSLVGADDLLMKAVKAGRLPLPQDYDAHNKARRAKLKELQAKLQAKIVNHPKKIEYIHLSVFGFSRGAAQARAFVNWLYEVCEKDSNGFWRFAGLRIRVQFLGILDTVASVGLTNLFENDTLIGHQSWADDNLQIHPAVEQCVHYVAGHEVRACFPSDSVRVKNSYPANAKEVMYPGAHSDVGGGYAPNALGVASTQDTYMSIIPGAEMHKEARAAGVPLQALEKIDPTFAKALTPQKSVIEEFNAYLKHANVGEGAIEDMGRRHMALYFSYRFKNRVKYNEAINLTCPTPDKALGIKPYAHADIKDQGFLAITQNSFIERLRCLGGNPLDANFSPAHAAEIGVEKIRENILNMYADKVGKGLNSLAPADVKNGKLTLRSTDGLINTATTIGTAAAVGALLPTATAAAAALAPLVIYKHSPILAQTLYQVAKAIDTKKLTPEIETFFDKYIHDSMAGFIAMGMNEYQFNGIGIVKFRSVYKGNDWSVVRAVEEVSKESYDTVAKKTAEAWDASVKKYEEAKAYADKKAQEVAIYEEQKRHAAIDYTSDKMTKADQYVREKAGQVKEATINTYDASIAEAKRVAAAAKKEADLLAEEARKKAEEAKQKAQEAADYGKKVATEAGAAAGRSFELFWDGFKWVTKQALEGASAIKG